MCRAATSCIRGCDPLHERLWRENRREYRPSAVGLERVCSRNTRGACAARVRHVCGTCAAVHALTVAGHYTAQASAVGLELVQPEHSARTRTPSARHDGTGARPTTALPPTRALRAAHTPRRGTGRIAGSLAAGGAPYGFCQAVAVPRREPCALRMHGTYMDMACAGHVWLRYQ